MTIGSRYISAFAPSSQSFGTQANSAAIVSSAGTVSVDTFERCAAGLGEGMSSKLSNLATGAPGLDLPSSVEPRSTTPGGFPRGRWGLGGLQSLSASLQFASGVDAPAQDTCEDGDASLLGRVGMMPGRPGDVGSGDGLNNRDSQLMNTHDDSSSGLSWCEIAQAHIDATKSSGIEKEVGPDGSVGWALAGLVKDYLCRREQEEQARLDGASGAGGTDESSAADSSSSPDHPETQNTDPANDICSPDDVTDATTRPMPDDDGAITAPSDGLGKFEKRAKGLIDPSDPDKETRTGFGHGDFSKDKLNRARHNPYIYPENEHADELGTNTSGAMGGWTVEPPESGTPKPDGMTQEVNSSGGDEL